MSPLDPDLVKAASLITSGFSIVIGLLNTGYGISGTLPLVV